LNFLGIGVLEIVVILVIALVVLGPGRTVNMARSAGKMLGEVRRAMGDLSRAVEDEERELNRRTPGSEEPGFDKGNPPLDKTQDEPEERH